MRTMVSRSGVIGVCTARPFKFCTQCWQRCQGHVTPFRFWSLLHNFRNDEARHCKFHMQIVHGTPPHHTTTVLRPFFRDHPGEPVPEENFWTLWCKGRLTEADTLTIQMGTTPSGLTMAHRHTFWQFCIFWS